MSEKLYYMYCEKCHTSLLKVASDGTYLRIICSEHGTLSKHKLAVPIIHAQQNEVELVLSPKDVRIVLLLVMDKKKIPPIKEIFKWDEPTKKAVVNWAGAIHLEASDNIVKVPDEPQVLIDWVASLANKKKG